MRLVRHFLAVSIVVGLVVALGFVWSTSGAASVVADDRGRRLDQRGAGGFSLSNVSDLVQTLIILALITAAVVTVDRTRRRRRHRGSNRPTAS